MLRRIWKWIVQRKKRVASAISRSRQISVSVFVDGEWQSGVVLGATGMHLCVQLKNGVRLVDARHFPNPDLFWGVWYEVNTVVYTWEDGTPFSFTDRSRSSA